MSFSMFTRKKGIQHRAHLSFSVHKFDVPVALISRRLVLQCGHGVVVSVVLPQFSLKRISSNHLHRRCFIFIISLVTFCTTSSRAITNLLCFVPVAACWTIREYEASFAPHLRLYHVDSYTTCSAIRYHFLAGISSSSISSATTEGASTLV